jgi:predicted transcriptional regulator
MNPEIRDNDFVGRLSDTMTVAEIAAVLDAKVICGEDLLDRIVHTACGSDLMSDVLAFVKDQSVLITGLTNAQAVRTAEMMDIGCIVLIRGKVADQGMIALARDRAVVVLQTEHSMFTTCGILYENGLRGNGKGHAKKAKTAL